MAAPLHAPRAALLLTPVPCRGAAALSQAVLRAGNNATGGAVVDDVAVHMQLASAPPPPPPGPTSSVTVNITFE